LEALDSRISRFVSLRYFAGLTNLEAAETMGLSERTGNSYWQYARAWLLAEITRSTGT
jgi:DNA-directed RNA polymerase specialized sigma24 family protein